MINFVCLIFFTLLLNLEKVLTQKVGGSDPLIVPIRGNEGIFPNHITSDNFPLFPFTDQFNWGIELNPANKVSVAGDINVPVPGWGNFDVDGNLYFGNINLDAKVGTQVRPVNRLNIKPETMALLAQNPQYREARKKAHEVVVGRIPYGYEPIKCKPPYCNPFVHHAAVAVEVEEGDDTFFIGGLDFPIPIGENGAGLRFPLSGAVEQGTSPYSYAHGNAYNAVSPWKWSEADDGTKPDNIRRKQRNKEEKESERRELIRKFYRKDVEELEKNGVKIDY